jgi:hypothetical protein
MISGLLIAGDQPGLRRAILAGVRLLPCSCRRPPVNCAQLDRGRGPSAHDHAEQEEHGTDDPDPAVAYARQQNPHGSDGQEDRGDGRKATAFLSERLSGTVQRAKPTVLQRHGVSVEMRRAKDSGRRAVLPTRVPPDGPLSCPDPLARLAAGDSLIGNQLHWAVI